MTVSAGPDEATRRTPPAVRSFRANAFRVLSIPADAEPKLIYRRHQRLLIAIELDPCSGEGACGLKQLSQEEVLEAVHLLVKPDSRWLEELFWVHEMDCGDLRERPSAALLAGLREVAAHGTRAGAVARHNLAVLQTIRGPKSEPDAWEEVLQSWKSVLDDELFWSFMKARTLVIKAPGGNAAKMKAVVKQCLSTALTEQLVLAAKAKDVRAVTTLARVVSLHRGWLDLDAALESVGEQVNKEGFVSLGAVLDRVAEVRQEDAESFIRSALARAEEELGRIAADYGELIRILEGMAVGEGWESALGSSYQRLSLASFRLLGETQQAGRLMAQARQFASDPQLLASLQQDWRQLQWSVLYRDASALLQAGDFAAAKQKLADALAFSNREQREQVEALQEVCDGARAAAEQQLRLEQRDSLCREAEDLLRQGQFAAATQKLESAMAFSTEEEKVEIEAMQDRFRWRRVLHGVDTTRTRPALYRFLGTGATFLGRREYDPPTRSYLTNHWITFVFLPVVPIGTYRVSDDYVIYGKASLPSFLRHAQWGIPAAVLALLLAVTIVEARTMPRKVAAPNPPPMQPPPRTPSDDLEPERTAILALGQSLTGRQSKLEVEKSELEKQRHALEGVAAAYQAETVPQEGQAVYDGLFADYNRKVKQHERNVAQWQADAAVYHDRVRSFNARPEVLKKLP